MIARDALKAIGVSVFEDEGAVADTTKGDVHDGAIWLQFGDQERRTSRSRDAIYIT